MTDLAKGIISLLSLIVLITGLRLWGALLDVRDLQDAGASLLSRFNVARNLNDQALDARSALEKKYNRLAAIAREIYLTGWWVQPGQPEPIGEHVHLWRDLMSALNIPVGTKVHDFHIAKALLRNAKSLQEDGLLLGRLTQEARTADFAPFHDRQTGENFVVLPRLTYEAVEQRIKAEEDVVEGFADMAAYAQFEQFADVWGMAIAGRPVKFKVGSGHNTAKRTRG